MFESTRIKIKFLSLAKDPTKTYLVFEMMHLMLSDSSRAESLQKYEQDLLGQVDFMRLYQERWIPAIPSLDILRDMPKGSLGHAYFHFLNKSSLEKDFYPQIEVSSPATYLSRRLYLAHDLLHVLLGYDSSPTGEVLIQAFQFGHFRSPASAMLVVAGCLGQLDAKPEGFFDFFSQILKAFERGVATPSLLSSKFEDRLPSPLEDVRRECGLVSISGSTL